MSEVLIRLPSMFETVYGKSMFPPGKPNQILLGKDAKKLAYIFFAAASLRLQKWTVGFMYAEWVAGRFVMMIRVA